MRRSRFLFGLLATIGSWARRRSSRPRAGLDSLGSRAEAPAALLRLHDGGRRRRHRRQAGHVPQVRDEAGARSVWIRSGRAPCTPRSIKDQPGQVPDRQTGSRPDDDVGRRGLVRATRPSSRRSSRGRARTARRCSAVLAARARQPQSAARRRVLHGARQLASPRRRVPLRPACSGCISTTTSPSRWRSRRFAPSSARIVVGPGGEGRGKEVRARPQRPVLRSEDRQAAVPARRAGAREVRRDEAREPVRLHVREVLRRTRPRRGGDDEHGDPAAPTTASDCRARLPRHARSGAFWARRRKSKRSRRASTPGCCRSRFRKPFPKCCSSCVRATIRSRRSSIAAPSPPSTCRRSRRRTSRSRSTRTKTRSRRSGSASSDPPSIELVRTAYLLDAFGDLGNKQQIVDAYKQFSAAVNDIEDGVSEAAMKSHRPIARRSSPASRCWSSSRSRRAKRTSRSRRSTRSTTTCFRSCRNDARGATSRAASRRCR